jgi:hypothetical protein
MCVEADLQIFMQQTPAKLQINPKYTKRPGKLQGAFIYFVHKQTGQIL